MRHVEPAPCAGAVAVLPDPDANTRKFRIDGWVVTLYYQPDRRTLACFLGSGQAQPDTPGRELIRKVGLAFNEELKQGQHQDLFTTFAD